MIFAFVIVLNIAGVDKVHVFADLSHEECLELKQWAGRGSCLPMTVIKDDGPNEEKVWM